MQTPVLKNQSRLPLQAFYLIRPLVGGINVIQHVAATPNNFADDIALEGIALADWMGAPCLGLMIQRTSIDALSYEKGVRPAYTSCKRRSVR